MASRTSKAQAELPFGQKQQQQQQVSVVAQAKPAIISLSPVSSQGDAQELRFTAADHKMQQLRPPSPLASARAKVKFIEDESVILKQNAANAMRQAAVSAAAACQQQRQRLSATERLALSAKRPPTAPKPSINQQISQLAQPHLQQQQQRRSQAPASDIKPPSAMTLPTLETLLAVQRQLQRHTKQNLANTKHQPQDLVSITKQTQPTATSLHSPRQEKPVSFSKQPSEISVAPPADSFHSYEKELPPLPQSVSPSTCTDESQLNSLESQASSDDQETSLVSLPPPLPPISTSSYLQQYDEVQHAVAAAVASRHSNSSTPTTSSEVSSIRQFPVIPIKQQPAGFSPTLQQAASNICRTTRERQQPDQPTTSRDQQPVEFMPPPPPAFDPNQSAAAAASNSVASSVSLATQTAPPPPPPPLPLPPPPQSGFDEPDCAFRFPTPPPPDLLLDDQEIEEELRLKLHYNGFQSTRDGKQFADEVQRRLVISNSSSDNNAVDSGANDDEDEDGDGDDNDYDDEFQCRIPLPPKNKMIASAISFHDFELKAAHERQLSFNHSQLFAGSSAFSVPRLSGAEYRDGAEQEAVAPPPPPANLLTKLGSSSSLASASEPKAQLTVHISDNDAATSGCGLLSANRPAGQQPQQQQHQPAPPQPILMDGHNHNHHHHHHHQLLQSHLVGGQQNRGRHFHHHANQTAGSLMMSTMLATSSSSPSSSSDGDGHSSNSSSSTSGIHSSIESPSSHSSKSLDVDFNFNSNSNLNSNSISTKMKHSRATQLVGQLERQLKKGSCIESGAQISQLSSLSLRANASHGVAAKLDGVSSLVSSHHHNKQQRTSSSMMISDERQQVEAQQQQQHNGKTMNLMMMMMTTQANDKTPPSRPTAAITSKPTNNNNSAAPGQRPISMKQKKSVSFSDKIELVACFEEQNSEHLPNPLLARVLAQKSH